MEVQSRRSSWFTSNKVLLLLNVALLSVGSAGSPLILRLYFVHGGKRVWLSSWLQTAGFPVFLVPLAFAYMNRRRQHHRYSLSVATSGSTGNTCNKAKIVLIEPTLFLAAAFIGILTGFDNYLYAYGIAKLPVSTSALIIATQLGFTAGFAFLLVKQKFTFYSINSVALLTVGAALLALHASSDRPDGESSKQYVVGFLLTLAAAALYGFVLPLIELAYSKARQAITYALVIEIQFVISLTATLVCTVGMIINNDFKEMPREAGKYGLGETMYYLVLVWNGILGQIFFLGAVGVIFCASSLLSGIIIAVMLPVTEVLAVLFYREKFQAEKGVALVMSLWGFVSYFYGEIKTANQGQDNTTASTATTNGIKDEILETEMSGTIKP